VGLFIILAVLASAVLAEVLIVTRVLAPRICDYFEKAPEFQVVPGTPVAGAQEVQFVTADGVRLRGSLLNEHLANPPGLVLFMPELKGNHWMASRYCEALIRQGYVVFAFDFRNQGESDSAAHYAPIHWMTEYEMLDVGAAMEFIESHPRLSTLPILTFGVSRGGVGALLAGCRYPRVRGVIADSAFGTRTMIRFFADRFVDLLLPRWLYRFLPEWHVARTLQRAISVSEARRNCRYVHLEDEVSGLESGSVLLISGGSDSYVSRNIARRIQALAGPATRLWIAAGARHNMARTVNPAEYDRLVLEHAAGCLAADLSTGGIVLAESGPSQTVA
jgi:alpha-beta hydrolase superfamily lysophospholipase